LGAPTYQNEPKREVCLQQSRFFAAIIEGPADRIIALAAGALASPEPNRRTPGTY
jgi:hypothetical protein